MVFLGDILDFPYLSTKFLRTATAPEQILKDISTAKGFIDRAKRIAPKVVFVEGNHEARLKNYVLEKADALEGLLADGAALDLATLLGMDQDIYLSPYGSAWTYNGFVFKHGDYAGKNAAAKELEMEGSSGMSGHTHRAQQHSKTDRNGVHGWWSVGCLCHVSWPNMPPGKHEGQGRLRDWQQGFATIRFTSTGFAVHPVFIIDGQFTSPEGEVYG